MYTLNKCRKKYLKLNHLKPEKNTEFRVKINRTLNTLTYYFVTRNIISLQQTKRKQLNQQTLHNMTY